MTDLLVNNIVCFGKLIKKASRDAHLAAKEKIGMSTRIITYNVIIKKSI